MNDPRRLRDLIGNRALLTALGRGRLPAAALFAGPEGVGKRTAAMILAAAANCRQAVDRDPCGECPSCLKAFQGTHPDIRIWSPDAVGGKIRIEQMRELREDAQYRPFEGRRKCFLIDPADAMTTEAANCILKTLEEPAETTHLILITAFPDQLLPTIRSRCLQFDFQPVPRAELERFLGGLPEVDQPELRAALARGSVGGAMGLDLGAYIRERDLLLKLLGAWAPRGTFAAMLAACDRLGLKVRDRTTVQRLLVTLQDLLCDLYHLEVGIPERVMNVDRSSELKRLQGRLAGERLQALLEATAEARRDVDRNVKPDICFETIWCQPVP
jgi:DNA polymerase-3 subunit delta'